MKKILIALDGSRCSLREADYVGEQFGGIKDLQVTLFHVLPEIPAALWDDGHILNEEETTVRKSMVDKWVSGQLQKLAPILHEAEKLLVEHGIDRSQIATKTVTDSDDVAASIMEEAKAGGYQTLVMGRCGHSAMEHLLMGSVASKILHQKTSIAICVI